MFAKRVRRSWLGALAGSVVALTFFITLSSQTAMATTIDPLHGCENGPTATCNEANVNNTKVTPVYSQTPTYGFTISPGNKTGDFWVVTLIPDNDTGASSESFKVSGGATSPATATLFSTTAWTSGDLTAYLNLTLGTGAPPNPLNAFLPATQEFDSGATGYYVYVADVGTNTLGSPSVAPPALPSLSDGTFVLPLGTSIVGFLDLGTKKHPGWISTAQSGQLSIDAPTAVEPSTVTLLGVMLLVFVALSTRALGQPRLSRDRR